MKFFLSALYTYQCLFCIELTFISFELLNDHTSSSGVLVLRLKVNLKSKEARFLFFQIGSTNANKLKFRQKHWHAFTVKTVHACPFNFKVFSPVFQCRMRRSGNSSQILSPNVSIFQQNVRANLANFF